MAIKELKSAINKANDSLPGTNKVHYQFLKHLPTNILSFLLDIFNNVWVSGEFPSSWKEALVIPIPKPGKDSSNPNNYRPIALTSYINKTLEKLVNNRPDLFGSWSLTILLLMYIVISAENVVLLTTLYGLKLSSETLLLTGYMQ